MRLLTIALKDPDPGFVVFDPHTPAVVVDRGRPFQGRLAGLRIVGVPNHLVRIAERVHEVPNFRRHRFFPLPGFGSVTREIIEDF